MTSRLKIECGQLRSALFGCRHSTLQLHGLVALAKPLLLLAEVYHLVSAADVYICTAVFVVANNRTGHSGAEVYHRTLFLCVCTCICK